MDSPQARKILLVTDTWHPQINGVVTIIEHLKEEIERKGWVVDVLDPSQFFTVPLPVYTEFRLALFSRGSIRKRIKGGAYDEVHILTEGPMGWHARAACIRLKKRFTTSFHNQFHLYAKGRFGAWSSALVKKLIYHFHSRAACTLVTTESLRKQLLRFGLARVLIWRPGADERFFTRGACPRALEKPVFLFLGRVAPEKNIEEFLSAELPGTKIVIGDGPDKERLEAKYPAVVFLGYQTKEQLVSWMCCANVLVMPSHTETFGLVIIEALALGIPVAAHDVMGPRDIIRSGINGFLDEDIARAAMRCLDLSPERCRDSVKNYTWSAAAETFLSALQSARNFAA